MSDWFEDFKHDILALASEDDNILMSRYERGILQQSDSIKQIFNNGLSVGYASAIHDVLGLLERRVRK